MSRWHFWKRWFGNELDSFLEGVINSGLVTELNLTSALKACDVDRASPDALDRVCHHLVVTRVLTYWQCAKLRTGKWKGFFLDGYCFLEWRSKDMTSVTYLVKEVSTGKLVEMAVTPINLAPQDGRIHYEIKEISAGESSGNA